MLLENGFSQKKIKALAMLVMLIFSQAVPVVYAQQEPAEQNTNFSCKMSSLSKEEVSKILKLLADGFVGREIKSPLADKNVKHEKLENSAVLIPISKDDNVAAKVELANEKFDVKEAQHIMNTWINGPYSFGVVLTDTLRVGRCVNLKEKNIPCPLAGKQLMLRNSGTGIKSDFKPLWKTLKKTVGIKANDVEELTEEDYKRIREALGLPEGSEATLAERIAYSDDVNEMIIETYKRIPGKMIPNSILTRDFIAYGQTTCTSTSCIISVYSLFDKYYNNWFSLDMTFSTFGPVLLGRAKTLFGHFVARRSFPWKGLEKAYEKIRIIDKLKQKLYENDILGFKKRLLGRIDWRPKQYPEVAKLQNLLVADEGWNSGYRLMNPGLGTKAARDWFAPGGKLADIQNPVVKRELYRFVKDVETFTKVNATILKRSRKAWEEAVKKFGYGSPQEIKARLEYAKTLSKVVMDYDDVLMPIPKWISRDDDIGLALYAVKRHEMLKGPEPRFFGGDRTPIWDLMRSYSEKGNFEGMRAMYEVTDDGKLVLYGLRPKGKKLMDVDYGTLEKNFDRFKQMYVQVDDGSLVPVTDWSLPLLKESMTGARPLYMIDPKEPVLEKLAELSPEEFAAKLAASDLQLKLATFAPGSATGLRQYLEWNGFALRRYTSLLDRAIAHQDSFFHNYIRWRGGLKWTAYFNLYWLSKRGFNQKFASAYMLPTSWQEIRFTLGKSELYNDAFIDFFANAGSDQGDLFNRALQAMPWEFLASNVLRNFKPARELYEKIKGNQLRNKVENLALYASTPEACANCGLLLRSDPTFNTLYSAFFSERELRAYLLEDVVSEKAKKKGTTLIMFARHMDLEGRKTDVPGKSKISLEEAIKKKKTCRDAVKEATLGIYPSWLEPHTIGFALAFGENLGYALMGMGGVFVSGLQQLVIAPKLQDCVDVDGGYYVHIFVPAKEELEKGKSASEKAAEEAAKFTENIANALAKLLGKDANAKLSDAANKISGEAKKLAGIEENDEIVQATVIANGKTAGSLEAQQLLSIWFKGEANPSSFRTEGKQIIKSDENRLLLVDFENGKIYLIDGEGNILEKIVDNNIATRLISTNTSIPAQEIPQRVTVAKLPDTNKKMFELTMDSELIVYDSDIASCIIQGVEYQTGTKFKDASMPLNLTPVFGKALAITTDTHAVKAVKAENKIIADGIPRVIAYGNDAKAVVLGNRSTYIVDRKTGKQSVGLFESVQFENGVIIYRPDTKELIIWLKRNKLVELPQEYVKGIVVKPNEFRDAETDCPVPAIDIEAIPSDEESIASAKVEAFNRALKHLGPFNILETPTKRYVFYAKYEPDGKCVGLECCKTYFKIIDKKTGKTLYEAPIENFEVTPEGIHIRDAKGNEHWIKLVADNGVPMLIYNNEAPEPLISAQGPNGAFWYDPEKGRWYAENAQLLPLLEAFRNGALTQASQGTIVTRPGDNIMNIQAGFGNQGLALPSVPNAETAILAYAILFIASFLGLKREFNLHRERRKTVR